MTFAVMVKRKLKKIKRRIKMTIAEFNALPEDMRIARVYYDTKEHIFVVNFYDHDFYKNWGHWYREAVNKKALVYGD